MSADLNEAVANVEAMGKHQCVAGLEVGRNVVLIDLTLDRIRRQHHDDVGFGRGVGIAQHT